MKRWLDDEEMIDGWMDNKLKMGDQKKIKMGDQ